MKNIWFRHVPLSKCPKRAEIVMAFLCRHENPPHIIFVKETKNGYFIHEVGEDNGVVGTIEWKHVELYHTISGEDAKKISDKEKRTMLESVKHYFRNEELLLDKEEIIAIATQIVLGVFK